MDDIIGLITQTKPVGADPLWLPTTPTIFMPEPSNYLADYRGAKEFIKANKSFITTDIIGWIAAQKAGNGGAGITPFTPQFEYNSDRCARDVGFILDAIVYDLTYGGNLETRVAANAYFVGVVSQLGEGQTAPTIAAYERLRDVVKLVAQAIEVSPDYTSTPQVTTISGVTGGGATTSE